MNERVIGWFSISSIMCACSTGPAPEEITSVGPLPSAMLIDMTAWEEADPAVAPDPFASHQPQGGALGCPTGTVLLEGSALEIRTGICAYAWLQQMLAADLREGDPVEIVYWHSALVSDAPASAHVAFAIGDQVLFERTVEIPSDPAAYTETFEAPFSAEAGNIATLHLHNHGVNDWSFLRLERVTGE